ncbi:MAG: hypothetical protein ABWY00_02195 [Dongiaceae bacterium]
MRSCRWLIATGPAAAMGPQFLPASSVIGIARALADLGQPAAILAIDPQGDPALVDRQVSDGVPVFSSPLPVSTLPALRAALGYPRLLCLPNLLAAYGLMKTRGLMLSAWLGEDDLALLANGRLPEEACFFADSAYVAGAAAGLTQQPVSLLVPPLVRVATDSLPTRQSRCVAVIGARPADGIEMVLRLAAARRDLKVIIAEWPVLDDDSRGRFFATAMACGNVDWRRPADPSALVAILAESCLVLAPVMLPIGHRDWIAQARRLGRPLLGSHHVAACDAAEASDRILAADAPLGDWLGALDHLLVKDIGQARAKRPEKDVIATDIAGRLLVPQLRR